MLSELQGEGRAKKIKGSTEKSSSLLLFRMQTGVPVTIRQPCQNDYKEEEKHFRGITRQMPGQKREISKQTSDATCGTVGF